MRRLPCIHAVICLAALLTLTAPIFAESMGVSGGHDLDALWSRAQKQFDLKNQDAVLLLESRHISIQADGNMRTAVHRLVWIGTERGIDDYADLRIPYNSATSTLKITTLRTWRDGRWWPDPREISETAVIETLPFAMARADDYTSMRETMLLHDGVELPCIMETAYEIMTRAQAVDGGDGMWIFPQRDPALLAEYVVRIPEDKNPVLHSGNGAPEPAETGDGDQTVTYTWKMENVAPLGSPRIAQPASYAPYVIWSTWPDWATLGRKIVSGFDDAAVLSDALADTLAERLQHEPSPAAKARKVAALVNEYARGIDYDTRFWSFSPRPATRTWETAYGHALDRAVLAAAMFRAAGFGAEPLYFSHRPGVVDLNIPGLSDFEDINVLVDIGQNVFAVYNPAAGKLKRESHLFFDRFIWRPGSGNTLAIRPAPGGSPDLSSFELVLALEPGTNGDWNGTGYIHAGGIFCPFDEMTGLHGEALSSIGGIVRSVLPGADVGGYNPEAFSPTTIDAGFDFTLKTGDPDDEGRIRLAAGDPSGGILAVLPSDVHLYHERRDTPVLVPGNILQRVELRIKTGDREIIRLPGPRTLENEAGRYMLRVENEDGWMTVDRTLELNGMTVAPGTWPLLRALLLEETDAAGRTIMLKYCEK